MKPMKVDQSPAKLGVDVCRCCEWEELHHSKAPCSSCTYGVGAETSQFKAKSQGIFREAISPLATDRPFPVDVMVDSHVCKACERTRIEQDLSLRLREMGDIELGILASTQSRLLLGQGQYGKFETVDKRDLLKESLEEVQDALVYVAKRLSELGR